MDGWLASIVYSAASLTFPHTSSRTTSTATKHYWRRHRPRRCHFRPGTMPNWWTGPAAAIFVLLFAFTDSAFQLDPLKSNKLAQLFLSRNLSLQFDVQQRNGSENVLFEIIHHREQQQQKQPIFRFSTSTIQNNLLLEFQLEDGRRKLFRIGCPFLRLHEQFHKIIFLLNDNKIVVIVNCQQLFSAEDNELNFGNFALRKLNAKLVDTDNNRGLHLRQFSADSSIQLESQCPNLQTLIGNRIATEYLPAFEMNHVPMPAVEPTKQQNPAAEAAEGELFQQRVELLEHQLAHWNKLFARFESRIKRVELHQRGCTNEDGSQMAPGQRVQNLSECMECQCGLDGDLHCRPIGCPRLDCEHPVQVEGKCCPECGQRCLFSGNYYNSGETYWPKPCIFCRCDNGKMACQYKDPKEHCPVLDCPERETLPNQCCPVCVNVDHCAAAARNPCSEHANCRSGRHSAICRCKEGFFGNGTKCYDVDECLWDVDARKQLGGCGDGTVCVNLPGTFKCECLPGYQKLDSRNCLDVIRI